MNSHNFSKGDILRSTHRDLRRGYHPIIYFESIPHSNAEFIGCMITHLNLNGNIELLESHFDGHDENGNPYQVSFDNSYLVQSRLIKFEGWGPFTKVGQLSIEGVAFVEEIIGGLQEETFAHYYRRTRS